MSNRIRWFAFPAVLLVTVTGVWFGKTQLKAQAQSSASAPQLPNARRVEVVTPHRRTMSRVLDVPATMQAFEQADLYAKVSGYVGEVRVDIGDEVKTGNVLLVLVVPEMADELHQAEATLAAKHANLEAMKAKAMGAALRVETAAAEELARKAEAELQQITATRKAELFQGTAIPQQEYDEAQSKLSIAQAQLKIAEAQRAGAEGDEKAAAADVKVAEAEVGIAQANISRLKTLMEYLSITAPFDGIVAKRSVDRGALVQAATTGRTSPLLTILRVDQLRIFIDVPETDVAFVHPGVRATVKPYGLPDAVEGEVSRIAESLNPGTRTMRAEIDLPNVNRRLYDGMYAQVLLEIDRRENVLTVPAAALLTEGKETYVFVVRDGRAERAPIKTDLDDGIRVEVTEGVDDAAIVVVGGKGLISDGMAVEAVHGKSGQ